MSGYVSLEGRVPTAAQGTAGAYAETSRTSLARQRDELVPVPAKDAAHVPSSPHAQVVINQILTNAESLIASVLGTTANEVTIRAHVGRYEF